METQKGLLGAIFDFSFSEFITTKIVKFLYILAVIGASLTSLVAVVSAFSQGFGIGILALVLSPLYFLVMVIGARIWLELIIVIFRIAEHVGNIADQGHKEHSA